MEDSSEPPQTPDRKGILKIGYQILFDSAPVGIVIVDMDGNIVEGNSLFGAMVDHPMRELVTKHYTEMVHPDDLDCLKDRLNSLISGEFPLDREERRLLRSDGSMVWFDSSIAIVRDKGGNPLFAISAIMDITDRKRATEDLWNSEMHYRLLAENVKDLIWMMDADLNPTFCSPVVEGLLGYTPEEFMAIEFGDLVEHTSMDVFQELLLDYFIPAREGSLGSNSTKTVELQLVRKDLSPIWTETAFSWILDEDRTLETIFCISRDISERKKVQTMVRQSDEKFNLAFKMSPYPAIITSVKDDIIFAASDEFLKMADVTEDEVVGKPISGVGITMDINQFKNIKESILKDGIVRDHDVHVRTRDGLDHYGVYSAVPLVHQGEQYILSIAKDVTGERIIEQALKDSQEWNRVLAEATFDAILIHDGMRILEVNTNASMTTGYSREELLGRNPFDLVHPDFHEMVIENMGMVITDPSEIKGMMKDGAVVDVEFIGADIPYKKGKARIVAIRNISERKKAEQSLRYRSNFEHLGLELASRFIGLKSAEIDAHIVKALGEISAFVGADAGYLFRFSEDGRKANLTHLWYSDKLKVDLDGSDNVGKGGWKWSLDKLRKGEMLRISSLDELPRAAKLEKRMLGSMGINSTIGVPMSLGGTPFGFLGLCSTLEGKEWSDDDLDIVQLVAVIFTNALQRKMADHEISNIFNISLDLIGVFNLDSERWSKVNPSFERLLGYKSKELLKMDLLDIIHPNDRGQTLAFLGRLDDEGGHSRWKTRVLKKDGEHIWIEWTMNPSSEDRRLYIFGTDVTERESARESMMKRLLKYNLEDGSVYIVKEEKMETSAEAFLDLLNVGYNGVAFSRRMDTVLSESEPGRFTFHWLSERNVKSAVRPKVAQLEEIIQALPSREAILIDRLDFIIFKNGFEPTLSFIEDLQELAYLNNHIIILSIDPATLEGNMLARLEKECLPLESIHKTILSHELMAILKVIAKREDRNLSTSYFDIISDLGISKPTTRKRIRELIYFGYLFEVRAGRRKTFALSEKGRPLFL